MTTHDANWEGLSDNQGERLRAADMPCGAVSNGQTRLAWQHIDDTQLVKVCQAELPHVMDAFEELVRRYESLVFHSCRHSLGNTADAEEVSQDIFLRIFHALPRFEGRSSFRTWLFRIVHNCCMTKRSKLVERAKQKEAYIQALSDDW